MVYDEKDEVCECPIGLVYNFNEKGCIECKKDEFYSLV